MWYRESNDEWAPRYEVRRSKVMEYVCSGVEPTHDEMYGVYASRDYSSGEAITAYVGKIIGAYDGERDDYAGYREMERVSAPREDGSMGKGGRHVMVVGGDLVDGADGYTGAQYINAAYHIPAAVGINKAEMKAGKDGTIRVVQRKTIKKGEEILMAYHSAYWNRWRPAQVLPRGRPKRQRRGDGGEGQGDAAQGGAEGGTSSEAAAGGEAAANGDAGGSTSGGASGVAAGSEAAMRSGEQVTVEWAEDGGRRIGEACASAVRGQSDGRGRGRPRVTGEAEVHDVLGKRSVRSTRWNAVSRNVYQQVQQGCRGTRYERGEGGGVT